MPLSFRLNTIFYVMALLAAALTVFGAWGTLAAAYVLAVWIVVQFSRLSNITGVVVLALTWIIAVLPLLGQRRGPNYRSDCHSHLRELTIGLQNYHAAYGSFPPPYIADANGKPMHSWRVLILPFIESQALYNAYDFNEPWDGPNNTKLWDKEPFFRCPGEWDDEKEGCTSYFAVVGENSAWRDDRPRTIWEFTDDHSQTILLIESSSKKVNWMEPVDMTYEEALQQLTTKSFGGHRNGNFYTSDCQAGMADGRVQTVWPYDRPETAKALLTINGRDHIEQKNIYRREVEGRAISKADPAYIRQISFALFIALAILPAFRLNRPPAPPLARESSPS